MRLTVTEVVADHGSVVTLRGIEFETDRIVIFGADHRPAEDIALALASGYDVDVEIEDWQILSIGPAAGAGVTGVTGRRGRGGLRHPRQGVRCACGWP